MKRVGRHTKWISLTGQDNDELKRLIRTADERGICRAVALLAMADKGTSVHKLADQVGLTRSAIWRLCRRFEERWSARKRKLIINSLCQRSRTLRCT